MGEVNNFGRVAGEISDGGIDLAQRYLHYSSVKAGGATAKSRRRLNHERRLHSVKIRDDGWLVIGGC